MPYHLFSASRSERQLQPVCCNFNQLQIRFLIVAAVLLLLGPGVASDSSGQVVNSFTEPVESSHVAADEPGVIATVLVREGQPVTMGQPLGELNHLVLQRSLEIARLRADSDAKLRSTQATMRLRQRKINNLKPLLENGHANPAEVEQAQSEFEAARADFELAGEEAQEHQLEVSRIQAQINRRIIHSPIDGWITEIHSRPGEYIASTDPRFATVVKLDQLRVRFYLLARDVQPLRVDQIVALSLGEENASIRGLVEFVSPVTDPDSGTARVDVLIDNSDLRYRSGTSCRWIGRVHGGNATE